MITLVKNLQVANLVVKLVAVKVVDILRAQQRTAEMAGHDNPVLINPAILAAHRGQRIVRVYPESCVTVLADNPGANPVCVVWSGGINKRLAAPDGTTWMAPLGLKFASAQKDPSLSAAVNTP